MAREACRREPPSSPPAASAPPDSKAPTRTIAAEVSLIGRSTFQERHLLNLNRAIPLLIEELGGLQ
jgi:hypothetical protein